MPLFNFLSNMRCIAVVFVVVLMQAAPLRAQRSPSTRTATASSKLVSPLNQDEYPISNDNTLRIPVQWHKASGCFLVDTGATHNAVDQNVFGELPVLQVESGESIYSDSVNLNFCEPPELVVGPIHLDWCGKLAQIDFSRVPRNRNLPVIGCLGQSALSSEKILVDFDQKRFSFMPKISVHPPDQKIFIPLHYDQEGEPTVECVVNGRRVTAVIDTGCNGDGLLSSELFDSPELKGLPLEDGGAEFTAGGASRKNAIRKTVGSIGIGEFETHDVKMKRGGKYNIIGMGILSRCSSITIDFSGQCMYVKIKTTKLR
jgi:predicted aspartyl protease